MDGEDPVPLRSAIDLDSVESVSTGVLVERLGRLASTSPWKTTETACSLRPGGSWPHTPTPGDDAYTDLWTKAVALLHSVVKNHPLVDGSKRLGWLACAVFLDINGTDPTRASNNDVYDLVMHVAAHPIEIDEGAHRLRTIVTANG